MPTTIDASLLVIIGLAAATVGALLVAARALFLGPDAVVDRLQQVSGRQAGGEPRVLSGNDAPLTAMAPAASGRAKAGSHAALERQLIRAGFRGGRALRRLLLAKAALAVGLPVGSVLLGAAETLAAEQLLPIVVGLCAVGLYAPNVWLHVRVKGRQDAIERSLPETMDLLVTCVEAGLGVDAALARVAGETRLSAPLLASELNLAFLEIQAGIPRVEAFRRLAERTGVEDLRSLAATLAQTELFGTSIATALRVRADWMRTRRMQRAEEQAAIIAVKMTVPLVFCILPSLVAVVMGPAILAIGRSLIPSLGGGAP